MQIKQFFKLSLIASAISLTACGGGGSSETTPNPTPQTNLAPSISVENTAADENTTVTLTASASDSDGTIASYAWKITSGQTVELNNANTREVSFLVPGVTDNDQQVTLSVTVTDDDGATATTTARVDINQITFPLTIHGLATDSPIKNAEITVKIAGRDSTLSTTANENGEYSVELVLDDSEVDSLISVVARGVEDQTKAGLISLVGKAGSLSALAGNDNILTADEAHSVNVTNITTAKYALAKQENQGNEIESAEVYEELLKNVDFKAVISLATMIKVAIDKAPELPRLALPSNISDTLALVEDFDSMYLYYGQIYSDSTFFDARNEIYTDDSLVDHSEWIVPSTYASLTTNSGAGSGAFHFKTDGTGITDKTKYDWQLDGSSLIVTPEYNETFGYESVWLDNRYQTVYVRYTPGTWTFKRIASSETTDTLLRTRITNLHFVEGELEDNTRTTTDVFHAKKTFSSIDTDLANGGVAFLPFTSFGSGNTADKATLNADGTGLLKLQNKSFNWTLNNGQLELSFDENDVTRTAHWTLVDDNNGLEQYLYTSKNNDESVYNETHSDFGGVLSQAKPFTAENVPGIYSYDWLQVDRPNEYMWFELHENGDADTIRITDYGYDGTLTSGDISQQYGKWVINEDGSVTISRYRREGSSDTKSCRESVVEGCMVYHERTWEMIGQSGNAISLFHHHKFYTFETDYHDTRVLLKLDQPPIDISSLESTKVGENSQKVNSNKAMFVD